MFALIENQQITKFYSGNKGVINIQDLYLLYGLKLKEMLLAFLKLQ